MPRRKTRMPKQKAHKKIRRVRKPPRISRVLGSRAIAFIRSRPPIRIYFASPEWVESESEKIFFDKVSKKFGLADNFSTKNFDVDGALYPHHLATGSSGDFLLTERHNNSIFLFHRDLSATRKIDDFRRKFPHLAGRTIEVNLAREDYLERDFHFLLRKIVRALKQK